MALVPADRRGQLAAAGIAGHVAIQAGRYAANELSRQILQGVQEGYRTAREWYNTPRKPGMKRARGNYTKTSAAKRRKYNNANKRTGGLIGLETKFVDCWGELIDPAPSALPVQITSKSSGGSTLLGHLTPVPQGTGESQRIGRNIWVKSLDITFFAETVQDYEPAGVAAPSDVEVSFFVVLDTQTNATTPAASAIWNQPVSSVALGGHPMRNLEYTDRFRILGTRRLIVKSDAVGQNANLNIIGNHEYTKFYKSWKKPFKQQYDATGGAIDNVTNEAITVWAHVTNVPYVRTTGAAFALGFQARARYTS